jgi:pilus biogenesis lipoprotein CpaD
MSGIGCRLGTPLAALRRASAGGILALLLAGCTTTTPWGFDLGDYQGAPRDLIAVASKSTDYTIRLDHGGGISRGERRALDTFLADLAYNRPESLRIVAHGRASPAQERAITSALVAGGVDPEHIIWTGDRRAAGGPVPRGTVVLAIERAIAITPNCLGFTGHPAAPHDNLSEPDVGCANAYSFAAMVADPHHLSNGASSIYSSGQRGASDVARYRDDKVKQLPPPQDFTGLSSGGGAAPPPQ